MGDANLNEVHSIILAGGFGTRLRPRVADRPKALADLWGQPFLSHQLDWLKKQGLTKITLAVHYQACQIEKFVEGIYGKGLHIDCVYEDKPLGTGGAIINTIRQKQIGGPILVLNGDTLFKFSLKTCVEQFVSQKREALLVGSYTQNAARYGTINLSKGRIAGFTAADGIENPGVVSVGIYFFRVSIFERFAPGIWSLEKEILPVFAREDKLDITIIEGENSFIDIGTPDAYDVAVKTQSLAHHE